MGKNGSRGPPGKLRIRKKYNPPLVLTLLLLRGGAPCRRKSSQEHTKVQNGFRIGKAKHYFFGIGNVIYVVPVLLVQGAQPIRYGPA